MSDKDFKRFSIASAIISIIGFVIIPLSIKYMGNRVLRDILYLEGKFIIDIAFIFIVVFICRRGKIDLYDTFKINIKTGLKRYLVGFLTGAIAISITILILYLSGNVKVAAEGFQTTGMKVLPIVLFILTGWIVQGAGEEFLIRGLVMKLISKKLNIFIAVFLSSIIFSVIHLGIPEIGGLAVLNITLYGIAMGLYVVKTNDLWGVCGNHAGWNFFQGNVFGLEVSGVDVEIGSIVNLNATGNPILNGGTFGPEAGLVCTIIELVAILILIVLIMKDRNTSKSV